MSEPSEPSAKLGSAFGLLWLGETAYGLAAGLMRFALGVWVYQQSRSVQQFAFVFLAGALPALFVLPWAGSIADRFERRWVIVIADLVAAALAVGLAVLLLSNRLSILDLYLFSAAGSIIASARGPSYLGAISSVIPRANFTRASGLISFSQGILSLVVPVAAAALMSRFGFRGIVLIQVPLVVAGALAVFGAFSGAKSPVRAEPAPPFSLMAGFFRGLSPALAFFRNEPLMKQLLIYMIIHDGLVALASGMMTPLILATHDATTVGLVSSLAAAGGLVGSLLLVIVNARKRLMSGLLAFNLLLSGCVVLAGFAQSSPIWCVCAFVALLAGTVSGGCGMGLWMRRVPNGVQGSVFSMLGMSQLVVSSTVVFLGSFLVEHLFEPALRVGGKWESSVGTWIGAGSGRGIGLLFVLAGLSCMGVTLFGLIRSKLRNLDAEHTVEDTSVAGI